MEELILTGKSLTHAQMMQQCLARSGISARTVRTPEKLRETGCGYAARIQKKDQAAALEALRHCGMKARKVYRLLDAERFEEVKI